MPSRTASHRTALSSQTRSGWGRLESLWPRFAQSYSPVAGPSSWCLRAWASSGGMNSKPVVSNVALCCEVFSNIWMFGATTNRVPGIRNRWCCSHMLLPTGVSELRQSRGDGLCCRRFLRSGGRCVATECLGTLRTTLYFGTRVSAKRPRIFACELIKKAVTWQSFWTGC